MSQNGQVGGGLFWSWHAGTLRRPKYKPVGDAEQLAFPPDGGAPPTGTITGLATFHSQSLEFAINDRKEQPMTL